MSVLFFNKNFLSLFWSASLVCLLMVGRIYDSRFSVNGFNIVLVINLIPILAIFFHCISTQKLSKKIYVLVAFIFFLVCYSIILFNFYDYNTFENYSIHKTFYLIYMFIPIIYFKYAHGLNNNFFFILYIACSLFFFFGLLNITSSAERMALFGGGPIVFARWIGVFAILSSYFIKNKIIKYTFILSSFFLIIKAGSIGPFIFLLIAMLFKYCYNLNFKKIAFVAIIITIVISNFLEFIIQIVGPRLSSLFTGTILVASSSLGRIDRWRLAIEVFLQNPLGVGFGNFFPVSNSIETNDFKFNDYPHNLFLEISSELGILGVIISILIILKFYKILKKVDYPLYQKELLLFLFLNAMVSGDIMDSRFFFFLFL